MAQRGEGGTALHGGESCCEGRADGRIEGDSEAAGGWQGAGEGPGGRCVLGPWPCAERAVGWLTVRGRLGGPPLPAPPHTCLSVQPVLMEITFQPLAV